MVKTLKMELGAREAIPELIRHLLRNDRIKAVFTLARTGKEDGVAYTLISSSEALEDCVPLYPLMPANAGAILSRFSLLGSPDQVVAAVLRPCEIRSLVELVKRNQASMDNILIISSTCGGVYPLGMAIDRGLKDNLTQYWSALEKGEIPPDIRPTCQACEHLVPYNADMTLALAGRTGLDEHCEIFLNTPKAEELLEGLPGELGQGELESEGLERLRNERVAARERIFAETEADLFGLEGLVRTFGRCISCHGCSQVCPVCYCNLCYFESKDDDFKIPDHMVELKQKGGLRAPPGTIFYHLGRLVHVTPSCVGCGACSDVCPADIPLSTLFLKASLAVQSVFDYLPGRDVDEPIPTDTFDLEELSEFDR